MTIFGVALLAICTLVGALLGDALGALLGVKSNVGGVGLAMVLLIAARLVLERRNALSGGARLGVEFWGSIYIPIVVAMAATQNVVSAISGGPMVVLTAIGTVALCLAAVAFLGRTGRSPPVALEDPHAERVLSGDAS